MGKRLLQLGVVNLIIVVVPHLLRAFGVPGDNGFVAASVGIVGVVTLFGVLAENDDHTKVTVRFSVAVAVTATWIAATANVLFWTPDSTNPPVLGEEAFTSLNTAAVLILGFYFGSKTLETVLAATRTTTDAEQEEEPEETQYGDEKVSRGGPGRRPPPAAPDVRIYD